MRQSSCEQLDQEGDEGEAMSNDPKKSPDTPAQERPDLEVLPKAKRRKFTASSCR